MNAQVDDYKYVGIVALFLAINPLAFMLIRTVLGLVGLGYGMWVNIPLSILNTAVYSLLIIFLAVKVKSVGLKVFVIILSAILFVVELYQVITAYFFGSLVHY